MPSASAAKTQPQSAAEFIPVQIARGLVVPTGRSPIARETVLSLGVRGELDVRDIAGRFVVSRASIDAYRERHGIK